jgi:hypothetical protein
MVGWKLKNYLEIWLEKKDSMPYNCHSQVQYIARITLALCWNRLILLKEKQYAKWGVLELPKQKTHQSKELTMLQSFWNVERNLGNSSKLIQPKRLPSIQQAVSYKFRRRSFTPVCLNYRDTRHVQ